MHNNLQVVVFQIDDKKFAVFLHDVQRVIRSVEITSLPSAPYIVSGIIDYEGKIIPIVNIRKRFGLAQKEIRITDQIVIVSLEKKTIGFVVDQVLSNHEVHSSEIKETNEIWNGIQLIEGVVKVFEDIVLICNLGRFFLLDEEKELEEALNNFSNN